MKKIFLCCLILLNYYLSYSQNKGIIIKYSVKNEILGDSLINGINKKVIIQKLIKDGIIPYDSITCIYNKKGDYVSVSNFNNINYVDSYSSKDKLIYKLIANSPIVNAIDVTIDLEEKLGNKPLVNLLEKKETVNDYLCSIIEIKWKTGTYRYYFSDKILKVNYQIYNNFNYDQWFNYLKIAGSLPIKIEKEINNMCKTTYVMNYYVEESTIDNSIFKIPKMKLDKELSQIYPNKKIFIIQ